MVKMHFPLFSRQFNIFGTYKMFFISVNKIDFTIFYSITHRYFNFYESNLGREGGYFYQDCRLDRETGHQTIFYVSIYFSFSFLYR